jgi:autotransporter-associated beta strand protein
MSRFRVANSGLLLTFIFIAALVIAPGASAQDTWTGGSSSPATNNMTATGNWSPAAAPSTGDALIFPAGVPRLAPNVNFASRRTFDTLTFGDDLYTMTGDGIGITNGIIFNNPTKAININLSSGTTSNLAGSQTWTLNGAAVTWQDDFNLNAFALTVTGTGNLTFSGILSGTGATSDLLKSGSGTLILNGVNTYAGGTTINGGTVQVGGASGSATGSGAVAVNSGGTLSGSNGGRLTGAITVASGGTMSPGTTGAGVLKVTAITLNSGATYQADLKGSGGTAGTDFDQINSTGSVDITGSTLSVALGYVPTAGNTYTIISTTGTITGQFAQGAAITSGGFSFSIAYTTTTVKLTALAPTSTFVWNGGSGADSLWTTTANWVGGTAPTGSSATDDLVFGAAGAARLTNTQPVMGSNTFGSISINTAGFSLTGGTTSALNTGLNTTYSGSSSITFPISVAASQTFNIGSGGTLTVSNIGLNGNLTVAGGGNLTISGNITNTGNINKNGTGTLTISGAANNYTGTNTIGGGLTLINADLSAAGAVATVVNSGILSGTGKTGTGSVTANGGTINPGAVNTVGTLTSGAVTMASGATLNIDTNGNGVNDNYSVTTMNFGGANLNINHLALPSASDAWTIVTSSGASSGSLSNGGSPICDSTPFTQNGRQYMVTYPSPTGSPCAVAGGAGNTVLTFVGSNTTPTSLSLNIPAASEGAVSTLTATFTDPDVGDSWTATVDWGDGSPADTGLSIATTGLPKPTHTYLNNTNSPYTVTVTITDAGGASVSGTTTATVTNVAPSAVVVTPSAASINEGDATFSISGSFVDGAPTTSSDDHAIHIQWGDGNTTDVGTFSTGTGLGAGVTTYGPVSHTYADLKSPFGVASSADTITVTVKDQDLATGSNTGSVTVNNVAPTLVTAPVNPDFANCTLDLSNVNFLLWTATCPVQVVATFTEPTNVNEGSTYKVDVKFSDSVTSNFDSSTATNQSSPSTVNKSLTFFIFNQPIQACTTVTDHNTGVSNQVCNNFTFNTPPANTTITSITAASNPPDEGQLVTLNGSFDDPNNGTADIHTITVRWGDGTADDTFVTPAADGNGLTFSRTHTYKDNGSYKVQIISNLDGSNAADPNLPVATAAALPSPTTTLVVNNVAPTMNTVSATGGNENDTVTLTGNIVDPGVLDSFTLHVDWGDGTTSDVPLAVAATSFSTTHQYLNNPAPHPSAGGNFTINLTLTDKDGGVGLASTTSTINNVAPVFGAVTETDGLFPGDVTHLSGSITDVGSLDTHQVVVNWGDGTSNTTLNLGVGVTTYNTTHTYALGGVYSITINGTDNDAAAATATGATATVPDFVVTAPVSSATVIAGQTGPFTIQVAQLYAPFTKPVALSCSGLPAGSSCSFAAPAATPGATFVNDNLSIATTIAGLGAPPIPDQNAPVYAKLFSYGGFGLAGFVVMAGSRRKNRKLFMTGMLLLVLGLVLFLPGCGASGGGEVRGNNFTNSAATPTPKGTYTITVTGTFSGPPSTAHSTTVTLTVN